MRLSNLHQNQRRMCTMWVSCFLWVCIFWRIIQVPDYSVLYFSFSETEGVRQTLHHADVPCWTHRIWWCTAHQTIGQWAVSLPEAETARVAKGTGRMITGRKCMGCTTEKRGGDYSRYLAIQELFRELTPLLSLMCIPLCFSVQPSTLFSQVNIFIYHYHQLSSFQLFSSS